MSSFDFLVETYRTERLKTLGVWSQVPGRAHALPSRAARPHAARAHGPPVRQRGHLDEEHAGHRRQPSRVARRGNAHGASSSTTRACSAERLDILARQPDDWYAGETTFFDVPRSRAWVLTRRFTHSAHHRGQLTVYLRLWGEALYSTYGPTADTGGLFQNGARVIYRYGLPDDVALPIAVAQPVTERPDR